MIDYLMQTGTMNAMQNGPGKYVPLAGGGSLYNAANVGVGDGWRKDLTFWCQVYDNTNPASPKPLNGIFLWASLPAHDPVFGNLTACDIIADRDKALAGDPTYLIFSTYTTAQRAVYSIIPVVAGAHYPFQSR